MSTIVSANEAAHRFGLSEKTVRRWIASGKLKADKSGRAYRVMLSEVAALVEPDTAHDRGPSADTVRTADIGSAPSTADSMSAMSGIPELVALVDRLQAEARHHAEAAAMWQERAGMLADRLSLAESEIRVLSAPQTTPQPQDEPEEPEPTPTPPSPFPAPLEPSKNEGSVWAAWWPLILTAGALVLVVALLSWPM